MVALVLVVGLWAQPDWALPAGWDYSTLVGDLFLLAFVLLLAMKFRHYRKARQQDPQGHDGLTWTGQSRRPPRRAPPSPPAAP